MFGYSCIITDGASHYHISMEKLNQTFKIDESLDSAIIVEPLSTRKEQYPRFKQAQIIVTDGVTSYTYNWLTFGDSVQVVTTGATQRYSHTIELIEPTKWLEKIPCGSLTFTQPLGGTRYTLDAVVKRIRTLCPFVRYDDEATTRQFEIDGTLTIELDAIDAPQFYFDKKNVREALVEVFKYINAIPRLTIVVNETYPDGVFVLVADKINDRHELIPFTVQGSKIIDLKTEISGENYATKVESFQENVIPSDDRETPNVYANSITDVVSFRNDKVILGNGSFKLILSHKIDKLISIKVMVDTDAYVVSEVDLTEYVVENKVFDTYLFSSGKGTQSCSAYWTYGSEMIEGFDLTYGAAGTLIAVENMLTDAVAEQFSSATTATWEDMPFIITYIPFIETTRSEQYREDLTTSTMESTIQINPSERINNAYKTTSNLYGQIQRLGVDTFGFSKLHKHLSAYVPSTNDDGIYSLGDYTADGYIITTVELVFYNHFVIARYEMSLNFNRIAQFMSIDKQFRPYEIALTKSDYTLKRDIMMPMFIVEIDNETNANHVSNGLVAPFMQTLDDNTVALPISAAALYEAHLHGETPSPNNIGVLKPLIVMAEKNTIKFKLDFNDTKSAGKNVAKTSEVFAIIYTQSIVPYTLADGTMELAKIELYGSYWQYIGVASPLDETHYRDRLVSIANALPYIDNTKNVVYDGEDSASSFVEVNIYATATEFVDANPGIGVVGELYLGLDTMVIYEAVSATEYAFFSDFVIAIKKEPVYTLPYYRILKDTSEILGCEMTLPIMPNKEKINMFVVGDMLSQDNVLVKPRTAKTLYFYTSATPFVKSNTKNVGSATRRAYYPTVTSNYITVPADIYNTYNYYAIGDYDGNMYLAVNQVLFGATKVNVSQINFNFLTERTA